MNKKKVIASLNESLLHGIAHRGYHNNVFTENGIKAFKNAMTHNLPIELDVHLTKDNELIVCHDENLKRTTGIEGIIEDLTLKTIRKDYKLLDGGEVPTFKEVLDLVNEQVPLVIELKVFRRNYKPLAKKVKELLVNVKDKSNFMIISFDPRPLVPFRRSGFIRSLLITESHKWTFKLRRLFESIDIDQNMFKYKRVRNYHKRHLVNTWTIESKEELENVLPFVDTVTFQNMDCEVVRESLSK